MVILLLVSWTRDMLLEAKLRSSSCSWQMECVGTKWMTVLFFFHILRYLETSNETMIKVEHFTLGQTKFHPFVSVVLWCHNIPDRAGWLLANLAIQCFQPVQIDNSIQSPFATFGGWLLLFARPIVTLLMRVLFHQSLCIFAILFGSTAVIWDRLAFCNSEEFMPFWQKTSWANKSFNYGWTLTWLVKN